MASSDRPSIVIGIGNPHRGDDGVGVLVANEIRTRAGDGVDVMLRNGDLLETVLDWDQQVDVVVVDAMVSGVEPGSIRVLDALLEVPAPAAAMSSHGIGISELVDLARTLDRLPRSLTVVAIEASRFGHFDRLTETVAAAVPRAADIVLEHLGSVGDGGVNGPPHLVNSEKSAQR